VPLVKGLLKRQRYKRIWYDTCTEQALLLLAEQPPEVIKALAVEDPSVRRAMRRLEQPAPEGCALDLKAFVSSSALSEP